MLPSATTLRTGLRMAAAAAGRILPEQQNIAFERWLRGYEEAKKLEKANAVIVSFGKSGRTWLRVMLTRYFTRKYGLPSSTMMEFDELNRRNSAVPILFFTHDNYLRDYTGTDAKFENYGRAKIVLLARDPRDTAVSQYFQWKHRIRPRKKVINAYPLGDLEVYDFIAGEAAGIPKIIGFMNAWAHEIDRFSQLMLLKYEDLRADGPNQLRKLLAFLGESPSDAEIEDAVSYASLDNMRRLERENSGKLSFNTRLKPADANDPASFKVRRGKVGGWRDYLTPEEAQQIDDMVETGLEPIFGYGAAPQTSASHSAG
jgi:Sulfotransferase domain